MYTLVQMISPGTWSLSTGQFLGTQTSDGAFDDEASGSSLQCLVRETHDSRDPVALQMQLRKRIALQLVFFHAPIPYFCGRVITRYLEVDTLT